MRPKTPADIARVDRYLQLMAWARRRYTYAGRLVLRTRNRTPSVYTRIENAAWNKYMA